VDDVDLFTVDNGKITREEFLQHGLTPSAPEAARD
jgi:hypothetical protein